MIEKSVKEIIDIFDKELKKVEKKIKSEEGYLNDLLKILSEIKKNRENGINDIEIKSLFNLADIIGDIFGEDIKDKFYTKCYNILNKKENILEYLKDVIYYIFDYSHENFYVKTKIRDKILNKIEKEISQFEEIPEYLEEKYYIIYNKLNEKISKSENKKFKKLFYNCL